MIKLEYKNIDKVYTCADIHGEFERLFNAIQFRVSNVPDEFKKEEHPLEKEEREENEALNQREMEEGGMPIITNRIFNPSEFMGATRRSYRNRGEYNDSIIFVCGDSTFGFHDYEYYMSLCEKFNKLCELNNVTILFIRGNHDDPSYFEEMKINFSNIKCLPDYSVVITSRFTTLCVGGGISIDRIWRKQQEFRINKIAKNGNKKLYWENEAPIFDGSKIQSHINDGVIIDSIVSHSSHNTAIPHTKTLSKEWLKLDKNLKSDMAHERQVLTDVFDFISSQKMKIKWWSYGHFHLNDDRKIKDTIHIVNSFPNIINIDSVLDKYSHKDSKKIKMPFMDDIVERYTTFTIRSANDPAPTIEGELINGADELLETLDDVAEDQRVIRVFNGAIDEPHEAEF